MKTKNLICLILAMILACGCAVAESDYTYFPESEEYVGWWLSGDISLSIQHTERDNNLFQCVVARPVENGTELTVYDGCAYDDIGAALSCEMIGVRTVINGLEDGQEEIPVFDDGAAAFKMNEDGNVVWTDFKAAPGEDELVFEKAPAAYDGPDAQTFADRYFRVLGGVEQETAGASLKLARACADAAGFAAEFGMWDIEIEAFRASMLEGWESLTDEERAAFDACFMDAVALIDACLEDWDAEKPRFEDAGAAEDMEKIVFDPLNRLAWENLRDHTLTMGNSEE